MREIWKDIRGYEGLYQVSNLGRVKSLPRKGTGGRILSQAVTRGYYRVTLSNNNLTINFLVHRLVAEAFIPNPNNYPQVNHKDENKLNNSLTNLEWCSAKYNTNYGTGRRRMVRQIKKPVMQYSIEGQELCYWFSPADASKELNGSHTYICDAAAGRKPSAYGYLWKYVG